jgi:hypothetical protein
MNQDIRVVDPALYAEFLPGLEQGSIFPEFP